MKKEVEEYLVKQLEKDGLKVLPDYYPDFTSKEQVDRWVEIMKSMFCE